MTTRTLDVALRIAADLDGAAKEVDALHGKVDGLKGAGQNAAQGLNAAATAAGKNAAADKANATAAQAAATAQKALGAATQKTAQIQQLGALSARQHAQAMRQLPMQITDIVTGLASGQSVFMVAIQQGGQLKDSFGGIVPAAKALLGTITPTVVAVTAGAAAFAAIGLAIYESQQQLAGFEAALIKTGASANITSEQLADMADRLDASTAATSSYAAEAITKVVETGQFSSEQLELVAAAALKWEAATGQALDETIAQFVKLKKDPVDAILELNETMHFLSEETLAQIRTFVEQGRQADATALAFEAYAGMIDDRAPRVTESLGLIEGSLRNIKHAAAEAWDEVIVGMRNADKEAARGLKAIADTWNRLRVGGVAGAFAFGAGMAADAAPSTAGAPDSTAVDSDAERRREKERKQAEQEWARLKQSNLSKQQKLEAEIAEIRKTGVTLGKTDAEIEAQIAQARARYKESLPKGSRGEKSEAQKDQEAAARELDNLQKQVALVGSLADGEKRVSEEARVRYEVENGAYRLASATTKQQLIDQAKLLDAKRAEREEEDKRKRAFEDSKRAYERLADALRTPVETSIDAITAQIQILNDAIAKGVPQALTYEQSIARIFDQAYSKAPEFRSPYAGMDDATGLLGDQQQLDGYLQRLNDWYAQQQAIIAAGRASNAELNAQWDEQEARARAEHAERLQALTQAQHQMQLTATASIFDSMAQIAYNAAGEQSKAYQILFAISKGFAIAQAAVALAQNIAEASKAGFPQNLPLIAAAMAQGANIAAILSGANFRPAGYAEGGYTGPGGKYQPAGIVHKGEGVLSQEDMRALGGPAGFHALRHAIHNGYADGGLVMPTERAEPFARMASPSASPVNLQNAMRLYLYQDIDALRTAILNHPAAEKKMVATVGENRGALEAQWSGG